MLDFSRLKLVRHPTLEAVECSLWRCTEEELRESTVGGVDEAGNEVEERPWDGEGQKLVGIYGYANAEDVSVHFWLDPSVAVFETRLAFFAHELCHLYLQEFEFTGDEEFRGEQQATIVEEIAVCACQIAVAYRP